MESFDCVLPFDKNRVCCDAMTNKGVRCANEGIIPVPEVMFSSSDMGLIDEYSDLVQCRRRQKKPTNGDRHRHADGVRYAKGHYYLCGSHFGKVAKGSAARLRKTKIGGFTVDFMCEQVVYYAATALMRDALGMVTSNPQAAADLEMIISAQDIIATAKSGSNAYNNATAGISWIPSIGTDALANIWDTVNYHNAVDAGHAFAAILSRIRQSS